MSEQKNYLELVTEGLYKTGFPLEHEVTEAFRRASWNVLNNRFYLDDVDGKARELDLVVYQIHKSKDIEIVTTILVSCKKNEQSALTFMSRDKPRIDPNIDWQPVHYWTPQEPLRTYLETENWKNDYTSKDKRLHEQIFTIQRDAFATQFMSRNTGSPQNDRPIFDSISGLMKALDHEIVALPARIKDGRIYIFNLVTVVDAPILDAQFSGTKIKPVEVSEFIYLSRYMVRKRDLAARIHFIAKSKISDLVDRYTRLAKHDGEFFSKLVEYAFEAIKTNKTIRDHFAKILAQRLGWRINDMLRRGGYRETVVDDIGLDYDEETSELVIDLSPVLQDGALDYLNGKEELRKSVTKLLRDNTRYTGKFRFDVLIPF